MKYALFSIVSIYRVNILFITVVKKTYISNLVCTTYFWNNLYQVTFNIKRLETQISEVFGSNKTKGIKKDSQNRLRSHIPEGYICI